LTLTLTHYNYRCQGGICRGNGGHVPVTEFLGMALNGLLCADVLRPLDLVPPSLTLPTNNTIVAVCTFLCVTLTSLHTIILLFTLTAVTTVSVEDEYVNKLLIQNEYYRTKLTIVTQHWMLVQQSDMTVCRCHKSIQNSYAQRLRTNYHTMCVEVQ